MKFPRSRFIVAVACAIGIFAGTARGTTLRIVSYNIDCEDQNSDTNITGTAHSLPTVVFRRHPGCTTSAPMRSRWT